LSDPSKFKNPNLQKEKKEEKLLLLKRKDK
jgi:hypothetical protein